MPTITANCKINRLTALNAMDLKPGTVFSTVQNPANVWLRTAAGVLSLIDGDGGTVLRYHPEINVRGFNAFDFAVIKHYTTVTLSNEDC